MAKGGNIEYGISFVINKQNLDAIQKSLDEIIAKSAQFEKTMPDYALPYQEAATAAKDFKKILTESWNPQIGKIDFNRVERGLVNLYGSTKDFKSMLGQIGPESQKVFNQFTNAIVKTQTPIKQTNKWINQMADAFQKTIRYGLASSVWNRFSNSIQEAYKYVKDLDKSLNDIRVVSGQSADQMERLAKQANKTAQALGRSTLDYTKAALIYYQQGLSGDEVTERTEVTLKMANVLGESAKDVSNYMTAIWNNFDKGSESLEHFADVITALGATTASSSQEIAEGLSKFAAVANIVGLSYEYATAALATVVAQTRQSADTVGTAFKTLFARIQDLELGKTLDDGVTLGKYALALQKVGITIKDSSGELKNMNSILTEMGEKWKTLTDAEKVALAQNVAGTRQYTQLIALMDNWGEFQANLATAGNAEGTLQSQQEIYLDSIEAHLQQLDTAWEGLYNTLFDEDALKSLTDALTGIIKLANTFVTGLGGGLNSIAYLAMTVGNIFSKNITQEILRVSKNMQAIANRTNEIKSQQSLYNVFNDSGAAFDVKKIGAKQFIKEQQSNNKIIGLSGELTKEDQERVALIQQENEELRHQKDILDLISKTQGTDIGKRRKEIEQNKQLTEEEKNQKLKELEEESKLWEKLDNNKEEDRKKKREILIGNYKGRQKDNQEKIINNEKLLGKIKKGQEGIEGQTLSQKELFAVQKSLGAQLKNIKKLRAEVNKQPDSDERTGLKKALTEEISLRERQIEALKKVQQLKANKKGNVKYEDIEDPEEITMALQTQNKSLEYKNTLYADATNYLIKQKDYNEEIVNNQRQQINNDIQKNNGLLDGLAHIVEQRDALNAVVSGFFTIGTSISALIGGFKTLFNPDLTPWEKFESIISVVGTQALMILNNVQNLSKIIPGLLALTGTELTLETAIAKVKQQGLLISIKELAINIKNAIVEALRALLHGNIKALAVATVAALAIGLVVLGKWVAHLIEASSEEYKLKEAVENTKKAAQEANEAYKETKEIFDTYKDARKNIDDLTEGTIEFYEAIQKSNEAAEKLIEKLGLVAGTDYGIDANGLINIDEDKLNQRMFAEQQKTFRAEARKYEAQLNLEKYNQKKIVEQFRQQTAVGVGYAKYGFSEQVARDILSNPASATSRASEMYGGQLERINTIGFANVTNAVEGSGKNIQGSIDQLSVDYKRSAAQQASLDNLIASNLILGYGSQSDVAEYNKMTSRMQEQVRQNIIRAKENNTNQNTAEDKNFWDYLWSGVKIAVGSTLGGPLGGMGTAGAEIYSYVDNAQQKKIVKEDYMKHVLGYQKNEETGTWYDRRTGATIDYDEVIDSIDTDEARDRYNSGEYVTQRALQAQVKQVENYKKQLMDTGLSKTSQNYVIEALMGNKDSIGLMSEEELKTYLQNRYNNIDADQLIANAKNGTFAGSGFEKFSINSDLQNWISNGAGNSAARLLEEAKAYRDTLADQAETLGTSAEALDIYSYAMDNAAGKTHKQNAETAEAAAAQYKFNKAYNEGRVTYANNKELIEKYAKALKNNKEISYDLADAVGEVSKSLKQMGLSLSAESLSKHLSLVNKLLSGTEKQAKEAYEELYKISQMDTLKYFFGDPKDLENGDEVLEKYRAIINAINETEPGKGMFEYYSNELAKMINDTELTVTQIKELADQLNIEIPVKIKDPEEWTIEDQEFTQKAQAIHHRYKGEMPDPSDPSKNLPVDYEWTEFIEDKTDHFLVPKNTSFKVNKNTQNISKGRSFSIAPSNKKSGSGSSNKPDKMDPIKTTIDRYHKVNTQITKVDNALKKLQSQQDKFVGSNLLANLNQQWGLLNTQIDNYTEKLRIANGEQAELAEKLSKKGVQFNEDGTISNYAESIKAQEDYVNGLIAKYNKMSKTQQEKYKETVETAKKNFDEFKTNLDRYDELVSDFIPGLVQNIQDSIDKQIEINIKKFNLEIEVTLNMNQATRDWNAWKKRIIDGIDENDILGNARARLQDFSTYYNNNGKGDVQTATKHVNEVLEELRKMDAGEANVYGDNRAQALEDLKNYYTQLMQSMTDVDELRKEMHEALLNEIDRVQEKFDEQIKKYEAITNLINHDMKMIQLYYGEDSYAELEKFYRQQQENNEKQLEMLKLEEEFWRNRMDSYEAGTEEYDKAVNNWIEVTDKLRSKFISSLQDAAAALKNSVQAAFKELNNKITGGKGLEYIKTEWDLVNKNADRYLDTINRTYAIRQLEKKYTDAINKNSSVANQQKLKKIMDQQILALKQQDELSQYQVDRANKLYEIELARMALEDARNNKSQMRLRRDSQGNYRYQYTANEEEINGAREQLEDLYNSLYNFDKERYNEVLNQAYADWEEYQQKMADAALINDPELRAEREKLIQEQYNELMERNEYDFQIARYNLHDSALTDIDRLLNGSDETSGINIFKKYTDTEEEIILNSLIPTWETGIAEMVQYFASGSDGKGGMTSVKEQLGLVKTTVDTTSQQMNETWVNNVNGMEVPFTEAVDRMNQAFAGENKDNKGGFAGTVYDGWVKIKKAENQYDADIVALESSSGITLEAIKNGLDDATKKTKTLVEDNETLIEKYWEELRAVEDCYWKVKKLRDAHLAEEEAAIKAAKEAYKYYKDELDMQSQLYEMSEKLRTSQTKLTEELNKAQQGVKNNNGNSGSKGNSSSGSGSGGSGGSSGSGSGGKSSGGGTKAKTTYTITLNLGYDGKKETKKVTEGESVTLPSKTRDGYKFNGWDIPSLGICSNGSYTYKPKKSETVTAMWTKKNDIFSSAGLNYSSAVKNPSANSYQSPLRTTPQTLGLKKYATGGYTGDWNDGGKLAILHQKELVLNQTDTKNMLNAVSIMRNLSGTLGTEMLARLSNASAPGYTNNGSGAALLEQDVHIDATFPNVRNAAEIEEALNNLVNAASQRAMINR